MEETKPIVEGTTTEETPFRVFKTQKEFDAFSAHLIKKTEEKTLKNATITDGQTTFDSKEYEAKIRKDLEAKIRADIKREAEMSEAEKLAEERRKMEEEFKQQRIDINRDIAKGLLAKAGFSEQEMDIYLDFVTEDRDVSLGKIQRVCDSVKSQQESLKSKWQQELQKSHPTINIGNSNPTITIEQAKNMTLKERTELKQKNPTLYETLFKTK